jgi:hypothetical protein
MVEIGLIATWLIDLPNAGGAMAPPASLGTTGMYIVRIRA